MPDRLPPLDYSDRFVVRYISANGDGIWNVYFGPVRLGRLSERHMRIEDAYGQLYRRNV